MRTPSGHKVYAMAAEYPSAAALYEAARGLSGVGFATAPASAQDLILSDQGDERVQELVGVAFANTLEAVYGPPEYGGNHAGLGWQAISFPGDVQPRGYTDDEVRDA